MVKEHEFEDDLMFHEFLRCLSDRKVPLKFSYAGAAARSHDAFARTSGYKNVQGDTEYELQLLQQLLGPNLGGIEAVTDIGAGNGQHSAYLIKHILKSTGLSSLPSYNCVDFSGDLLRIALKEIERANPTQAVTVTRFDVEAHEAKIPRQSDPTLFLLLGNTLANLECPQRFVNLLASSMKPGDAFLASFLQKPRAEQIAVTMASYEGEEFHEAVLMPFKMAGVPLDRIELETTYDEESQAVLAFAEFIEDWSFSFVEVPVHIPAGAKVRCFLSRRLEASEVVDFFNAEGLLAEVKIHKNNGIAHAFVRV